MSLENVKVAMKWVVEKMSSVVRGLWNGGSLDLRSEAGVVALYQLKFEDPKVGRKGWIGA
jgi:hypothetical protein